MAEFPLDGLDRVNWARLKHAYGPATDVPAMLRELAGDGDASQAFDQLFTSLNHQGSVYSATSAAIPFLIQILEDRRRSELVHFLGSVAEAENSSIGLELGKGVKALSRLMASEDPEERESAARALGAVVDHKGEAMEALRKAIKKERDKNPLAAMTESLATLDEKFAPSRGASARELFRAARAMARRERADISDKTLHQIAVNWRVALEEEASDAGEMIVLARGFPRAKQLQFYSALLGETTVPLEAVELARELLVVAFDDRRAWGSRGFRPQSLYCEFMKVRGKAPAWGKPLNPDQKLAVVAISKCDTIWDIATNLWSLLNLPTNRESFADLLNA
jgi:hypothetical protein